MMRSEIIVPETEPATEWILGRAVRKVSPRPRHALLQAQLVVLLVPSARGRGEIGTEWKFRVTPSGEETRPFVPDLAFVSFARLEAAGQYEAEEPLMAPDVTFEIRSPGDKAKNIAHKIDVYLRSSALGVVAVDPTSRTIEFHAAGEPVIFAGSARFECVALPGFGFQLPELFAILDPLGRELR